MVVSNSKISIIITVFNEANFISKCISSLLNQIYKKFELIIIDSNSTDNTASIICSFKDKRIKYIKTKKRVSIAKGRNIGIKHATGRYVFFIDADCIASKTWLRNGIKRFKEGVVGVEGKTYYASKNYVPSFSDKIRKNNIFEKWGQNGGEYFSCNIAYTKEVLSILNGFDERYENMFEDRDLGLRANRKGKIVFCKKMEVFHQKRIFSIKSLLKESNYGNIVLLIKDHKDKNIFVGLGVFACPVWLSIMICPPLLFFYFRFFKQKPKSFYDLILLPFYYLRSIVIRYNIWESAIKEKVFVI